MARSGEALMDSFTNRKVFVTNFTAKNPFTDYLVELAPGEIGRGSGEFAQQIPQTEQVASRSPGEGHTPYCMPSYLANHMNAYRTGLLEPEPGDPPAFRIGS